MTRQILNCRTFEVDFDPDAKELLLDFTQRDPFAIGLCTAYLSEHPDSLLELQNEFEQDAQLAMSSLIERVLSLLLSDSPPILYATCVLLSQCDEPFSMETLDGIWKTMPWNDAYPKEVSVALAPLERIGFVLKTVSGIELHRAIKPSILSRLSDADKQSAAVTISNYFAQSALPDEQKIPHAHRYLKKAGLAKESLQLAIAFSNQFAKNGQYQAAKMLIESELLDAERLEGQLRIFLRHQLSAIEFRLENFDSSLALLESVVLELRQEGNLAGVLAAQSQLANLYAMQGNFEQSLKEYEAVKVEQARHHNSSGVAAVAAQIGMIAFQQQNFALAVEQFYLAKLLSVKLSDDERQICRLNWEYLQKEIGEARLNGFLNEVKSKAETFASLV